MSRLTIKRLAVLGALSLGGMTQTAHAQWMPFGGLFRGGCGCEVAQVPATICGPSCAPPPVVSCAPPQPQYVMQPMTEMRTVEQVVQRPVYETKYVDVPQTEYRQEFETRVAQVPTVTYQNVTEMQTRQRDCGRWVTNYRCRPQVSPCAYDSRPGLLGMMNRSLYSTRMAFTPAVVAERTYVPNVITEQIPVTRQVAVPSTQQVTYQIPRTVAVTTNRKVAVQSTRYVAEKVQQQVQVTTMRMVPVNGTGMAYGLPAGVGTAAQPYGAPYGTAYGYPLGGSYGSAVATPDPNFGPARTATRTDASSPPVPIPPRAPARPQNPIMDSTDEGLTPAAPAPNVPNRGARYAPEGDSESDAEIEELAYTAAPVQHTAGFRAVSQVQTATSLPSIVRVSQWSGFRNAAPQTEELSVASNGKTRK